MQAPIATLEAYTPFISNEDQEKVFTSSRSFIIVVGIMNEKERNTGTNSSYNKKVGASDIMGHSINDWEKYLSEKYAGNLLIDNRNPSDDRKILLGAIQKLAQIKGFTLTASVTQTASASQSNATTSPKLSPSS